MRLIEIDASLLCLVLIGLILSRKKFRSLSIGFVRVMASTQEIFNLGLVISWCPINLESMKANTTTATHISFGIATAQRVNGGARITSCDDESLEWGYFIADDDLNDDSIDMEVEYEAVDFDSTDPYYQRAMSSEPFS